VGNTKSKSPSLIGQAIFHSFNALVSSGASGMVRVAAFDFSGPIFK
jgi:hypothetical protein